MSILGMCLTYIPKGRVGQFPIEIRLLCKWLIEDLLCSRLAWNLIYEKAPGRGLWNLYVMGFCIHEKKRLLFCRC